MLKSEVQGGKNVTEMMIVRSGAPTARNRRATVQGRLLRMHTTQRGINVRSQYGECARECYAKRGAAHLLCAIGIRL